MKKRVFSVILIFALLLSLFPAAAFAEEPGATMDTPIGTPTYTADTSLGTLLTRTLENDEGDTRFPGTVTDLRVEGTTATVELSTDRESDLVVAVYPDSATDVQMLATGTARIGAGKQTATVEISADTLPEFFVVAAYLLDPETHEPLSESYISRYYTGAFQAFLQTTTADYEQDLVLNLDGDEGNNFLVYSEDVLRFTETAGVNELTDNGDGTYTILHADTRFRNLKAGDSIAYTFADGTLLIIVVASVSVDGDTVTVTEDTEATLNAVFTYIKIDTTSAPGEGEVEINSLEESVTYLGKEGASLASYAPADTQETYILSDSQSFASRGAPVEFNPGTTFKFKLERFDFSNPYEPVLEGNLEISFSFLIRIYRNNDWFSATVKLDYDAELTAEVGAKYEDTILLGEVELPTSVPFVWASVPIEFFVKTEGKMTFGGALTGTIGGRYESDTGFQNLTSAPEFKPTGSFSQTIYTGIQLSAEITAVTRKFCETGIRGRFGIMAKGKLAGSVYEGSSNSKRHDCQACVKGTLSLDVELKMTMLALFGKVDREWKLLTMPVVTIGDFYYSMDRNELGWGTCPYISYKVTAKVADVEENPVEGAELFCDGRSVGFTDSDGRLSFWAPNGTYALRAQHGQRVHEKSITVKNNPKTVELFFISQEEPDHGAEHSSGTCGENLTWALYEDGTLVISGTGTMKDYYHGYFTPWQGYSDSDDGIQEAQSAALQQIIKCIILENGITSIGNWAFSLLDNLNSIIIPSSVTKIGRRAFLGCINLKDVYYSGTAAQWSAITIDSDNDPLTSATIHYNSPGPVAYESSAPLEIEFLAAYEGALGEQDGMRLASFSALKPGAAYTLLVTADGSAETLLAPENLLYIAQGTAEEDGSLTLAYIPRLDSVGSVKLYGPSASDLAEAVITVEQFGDGSCRVTVSYGDDVLTEDEDYLLQVKEEGLMLTATVTGCNGYSGNQTVTGEKLAVAVYLDANGGEGIPARVVMLLDERTALPVPSRGGWIFGGWAEDSAALEPDYLPGESYTADADALLHALWILPTPDCVLPAALERIENEAFQSCAFTCVRISDGMQSVGEEAFAGSAALLYIYIPESVTDIADNAFDGLNALYIYGVPGSRAETYAGEKGFAFIPLP